MQNAEFIVHNSHLEQAAQFAKRDPQLRMLHQLKYVHMPVLLTELPENIPGIYTVYGGRQIGKTTLIKQWMEHLLNQGVNPQAIAYFTGEIIVDHLSLIRQLQRYLPTMPEDSLRYVIIDEVTYINSWDMGVKFLADAGLLENVILILTGSDSVIIQEARMSFPGRRGRARKIDFHLYPLTFYEMLKLTKPIKNLDSVLIRETITQKQMTDLYQAFERYLQHGGYLPAINDFAIHQSIDQSIFNVYADWVRGDVIRHGKSDHHCREFFTAMVNRLNSQVTWSNISQDFSIEHHATVAQYASLLSSLDVIFVQQALIEDKLVGAPKKARKLHFTDPFIYHAILNWLDQSNDPYTEQVLPSLKNSRKASYLVESCVVSHINRYHPTYYIKAEGEVDVAYIDKKKFWPIEVKWTEQMRGKDLKQIQKYKNGVILSKQLEPRMVNNTPSYPLPWYLARIGLF